jgi:hypothetical protein
MKLKINNIVLIQLLYLSLAGITSIQKISGATVPEWFIKKFEATLIGAIPFGISLSFLTIILLEAMIALTFLASLLRKEYRKDADRSLLSFGMDLSMLLFLILFFGSFLAADYNNGALDFMYFGFTFYLKKELTKEQV